MPLTDPPNTLAHHQSRPLTSQRNMAHVPVAAVSARVNKFMQADLNKGVRPESEALWFYGMNHGMHLIQQRFDKFEPLPGPVLQFVEDYHAVLVPKAVRAFYYLLLICTRESRHNKSLDKDKAKIAELFGAPVANFHTSISGGEHQIHQALLNTPPPTSIGQYVKSLAWVFHNSSWVGGYGGPPWGNVADCLVRFVTGEFTAEMMLDTNWTLAHNNGPIFNKGMLYGGYDNIELQMLLDVQRGGQIPELILEEAYLFMHVDQELKTRMEWLSQEFPGKIGKYVDWYMVEALGANSPYPVQKSTQNKKYGLSPKASEHEKKLAALEKAKELKAKQAAEAEAKKKAEFLETHFEIMPGQFVEKLKIDREAA